VQLPRPTRRRAPDGGRLPPEPGPRNAAPRQALPRWRSERVETDLRPRLRDGWGPPDSPAGRANVAKRYLLQAAGANLALVMRTLYGLGTRGGGRSVPRPTCWPFVAPRALCCMIGVHISVKARVLAPGGGVVAAERQSDAWPAALRAGA